MSQVKVVCQDECVSIAVDVANKLMVLRWLRHLDSEKCKSYLFTAIECCLIYEVEQLLIDSQEFGLMTLADQSWLLKKLQDVQPGLKLKRVANIPSGDIFQQMVNEQISVKVQKQFRSLKIKTFLTASAAMDWLLNEDIWMLV